MCFRTCEHRMFTQSESTVVGLLWCFVALLETKVSVFTSTQFHVYQHQSEEHVET